MSSYGRTSSPILTMTPHSAHQGTLDRRFFPHPSASFGHSSSWTHSPGHNVAPPPRGRKRSRDEAAVNLDSPEKVTPAIGPVKENEDEWEYGPGMILIKKKAGYVQDASSQSGTWLEEKATTDEARQEEALLVQRREAQQRPSLRSHKSSRIDLSAASSASTSSSGLSSSSSFENGNSSDLSNRSPITPDSAGSQPVIDDFTLHLGIGWSRLSEDQHIQAAARGWARYIENHYPVTQPKILLESKGLESYLVEAQEGLFLFGNDLRQGRLVSNDPQRALHNLKSNPPVFDGDHVICAAGMPRPAESQKQAAAVTTLVTTAPETVADVSADLEMDMN